MGHDDDGVPVTLRTGRFGPFVQLGEVTEDDPKPKRASVPKGTDLGLVDLDRALQLLSLPRYIGEHPEGGRVETNIGRYGPYVMLEKPAENGTKKPVRIYANLPNAEDVHTIGMNHAVDLLAKKAARGGGRGNQTPLKELGEHPTEGGPVNVMDGRYGPYVKWQKVNATIPKGTEPKDVTMEMAVEWIAEKATKKKGGRRKKAS